MKKVPRILWVCLIGIAVLFPATALSDQLPVEMERTLFPGTNHVSYAGQNFVFYNTVAIHIKLTPVDVNRIKLTFKVHAPRDGGSGGGNAPSQDDQIQINWLNWDLELYSGAPPEDPWGVILETESGYTEK